MIQQGLFTSESVSAGHPDKMADQISDAILDAILAQDPHARVACETLLKTGMVLVSGEINTHAWVDIEDIVRNTLANIGYTEHDMGFDAYACAVLNAIGKQSGDIAQGVDAKDDKPLGAGDQGMMFGFACRETDVLMPAPIAYAHRLVRRQAECRRQELPWLRPDAKSQLTFRYEHGKPVSIDSLVFSTQHSPEVDLKTVKEAVMETIVRPTLPPEWLTPDTQCWINPTGRFVIGGPTGDCGLTGRKIIVDTYGGMARHGGGAFSGKDATKVDRSGAYMARYLAKNVVAADLATHCEIQLAYAIGVAEPTAIQVNTWGTGRIDDTHLGSWLKQHIDATPSGIIDRFELRRPIYQPTATYGHFGRDDQAFPWEATDLVDALKALS